jgi:thioester reductase-like protein
MPRPGHDEVVLLTGFPSFLARKMAEQILGAEPRTLLHLVVRQKFEAETRAFLQDLPTEKRVRVNVLEGDASSMDLGLSGKEFMSVAREIDRIHHCASVTYHGVDRSTAEQVNLGGAREIIELAQASTNLKALVVHSTASVCGNRTGIVREEDLDRGQTFGNVVEETKARAEKMMRAAMHNIPLVVLRPSIVVGDSSTGEVDRFDGPYLLILLIVTSPPEFALPLPGRGDLPLHLVPVDYVVRAAHAIGREPKAVGRTFHLVDPAPLMARRVFELVAQAGGRRLPRGSIPANLTRALLSTPGLDRFAKSPRAFLDALITPVSYSSANTDEILSGVSPSIRCPPFEVYAEKLVEFVQQRLREKRVRKEPLEVEDPLS